MEPMSAQQHQPIELGDTPSESVVEFGGPPPSRRRFGPAGSVRDLIGDRRVVPLATALAAVAFLASLLSEWQVNQVDTSVFSEGLGNRTVGAGVSDLGTLGTGYLTGLFALVASVVLTLSGPPAGRRYARLIGLSVGGTLFALLIALAGTLGSHSLIVERIYDLALQGERLEIAYGRGLWCAFAGVLLSAAALYLAGRHLPAVAETATTPVADAPVADTDTTWSWRRPQPADEPEVEAPLDLTVAPAKPFTSLHDDRDQSR